MKKKKITHFVKFSPGINQSRAEKQFKNKKIDYYDQAAFELDFNQEQLELFNFKEDSTTTELSLKANDVVISNTLQMATIVGKVNEGKVLPINFIQVDFINEKLDKNFFVYLFNANKGIKRQKDRETQGIGSVQRISLRSLEQLVIPWVPLDEQKKIGMAYKEMLKIQNRLNQYSGLLERLTNGVLEDVLDEE